MDLTRQRGRSARNNSSRHDLVTTVSNGEPTSQALTEVENRRHFF